MHSARLVDPGAELVLGGHSKGSLVAPGQYQCAKQIEPVVPAVPKYPGIGCKET